MKYEFSGLLPFAPVFLIGTLFGFTVLANLQTRHTEVTLKRGNGFIDCNFRSNNNNNGDTYNVTLNGDTISSGVFENNWK